MICIDYNAYMLIRQTLEQHDALITDEDFAASVTLAVRLPTSQVELCKAAIAAITSGQASIEEI
jgi:putative IMPACT (imprinted ancient) family translation regulator